MVKKEDVLNDVDDTELAEKHGLTREELYKRMGIRINITNKHIKGAGKWKKIRDVLIVQGQEDDRVIALRGLKQPEKHEVTVKKLIKL